MPGDDYDLAPEMSQAPAAKPRGTTAGTSAGGYARDGLVIVKDGAVLPDRCIKCNAPAADGRVTRRLSYDAPANKQAAASFLPIVGVFFKLSWLFTKVKQGRQRVTVSFCL